MEDGHSTCAVQLAWDGEMIRPKMGGVYYTISNDNHASYAS